MDTALLFLSNVIKHHGVPDTIVTDRGTQFTGKFWTALMEAMGTRHCKTTAFHPQSDGQTERVNRVLEDMLRHYVGSMRHTEWDQYLSMAEFAINNAVHASTGTTPFKLNYGRHPQVPLTFTPPSQDDADAVPAVARVTRDVEEALKGAKTCLHAAQQRMKAAYDSHRRPVTFSTGDKVLLSTRNIKLKRPDGHLSTPKLMPRFIGPFTVTQVIGKGAYRLDLPETLKRLHDVFNVCLLKPYYDDGRAHPPGPIPELADQGELFLIDTVLGHRIVKRGKRNIRQYLIKWAGYGTEHNSWEPEDAIAHTTHFQAYVDLHGPPTSLRAMTSLACR